MNLDADCLITSEAVATPVGTPFHRVPTSICAGGLFSPNHAGTMVSGGARATGATSSREATASGRGESARWEWRSLHPGQVPSGAAAWVRFAGGSESRRPQAAPTECSSGGLRRLRRSRGRGWAAHTKPSQCHTILLISHRIRRMGLYA
jgi:hypothetical protein